MTTDQIWLAAHYHFPTTYSCRVPLSSASSTLASPGPRPGTVRLALIRAGCEVFGRHIVQEELFLSIRVAQIRIRPPARVAFSQQVMSGYKARHGVYTAKSLAPSLQFRQVAQAQGALTVYIRVPETSVEYFRELLVAIGYWGQTDSLTMCLAVEEAVPDQRECAIPLRLVHGDTPLGTYFICVLADFRSQTIFWDEVVEGMHANEEDPLMREVYLWPMSLVESHAENTRYVRLPFRDSLFPVESKQGED
jgi:hypothetical protein